MITPHKSKLRAFNAKKFWARVEKRGSEVGCWKWSGPVGSKGYGIFFYGNRMNSAHRYAWALANGKPVPPKALVLHSCDNKWCVQPLHLRVGTHQDNMDDWKARGPRRVTLRKAIAECGICFAITFKDRTDEHERTHRKGW